MGGIGWIGTPQRPIEAPGEDPGGGCQEVSCVVVFSQYARPETASVCITHAESKELDGLDGWDGLDRGSSASD